MKMLKTISLFLLIFFITGCTTAKNQSSQHTSEVRSFTNIKGVSLIGSGDLDIKLGDKEELTIYAPTDLLPYLITEVDNGTLTIGKRKNGWKKYKHLNEKINYELTVKSIDHLKLSGSGDISAERLSGNNCSIKISGSGNIDIETVTSDKLTLQVSGSGDISIIKAKANIIGTTISGSGNIDVDGNADEFDLTISGSGNLYGANFNCEDASIDIYGSGDADLTVKNVLKAHISGSGDIYYGGSPNIDSRITGSGKIINRHL